MKKYKWSSAALEIEPGQTTLFLRLLGLVIFYPKIDIDFRNPHPGDVERIAAFWAPTLLVWRAGGWRGDWAFAIQIIGFGFGACWNWCGSPFERKQREPQHDGGRK